MIGTAIGIYLGPIYGFWDFPQDLARPKPQPSHADILVDLRSKILNGLLQDPDCLGFLGAWGSDPLALIKVIPITEGNVSPFPRTQAITTETLTPSSPIPINPSIEINHNGFFFEPGATASLGGQTFQTGTPQFQTEVLLHELGHATGVLPLDANSAKQEDANNAAIVQKCSKTINGAR